MQDWMHIYYLNISYIASGNYLLGLIFIKGITKEHLIYLTKFSLDQNNYSSSNGFLKIDVVFKSIYILISKFERKENYYKTKVTTTKHTSYTGKLY